MKFKMNLFAGILLGMLLFSNTVFAAASPWETKLPFKNGTIHYTVTGTGQGTQTTYIKDYGRTTAQYNKTTVKMFGMVQTQEQIDITTPDWVYSIDMSTRTGTKSVNPEKYMIEEFNKLSRSDRKKFLKNTEEMGIHIMDGMQTTVKKRGAKILGYDCDVISMDMGVTVYTIADTSLPLKTESNIMGMKNNITATRIEKGKVSSSKFEIPDGIHMEADETADSMTRQMAKSMVAGLVSGKPATPAKTAPQMGGGTEGMPSPEQIEQLMKIFENQEQ